MSESLDRLRQEVEGLQATLAQYRDEFEQLPERIKGADRQALHGPADGIQAALSTKKDLIARQEELDILIFRAEEEILKLEARQVDERLKPMAGLEDAAIVAEGEAEEAFLEAQKRLEAAQAQRRQIEHNRTSLTREAEKLHHAVASHRQEHTRRMKANG